MLDLTELESVFPDTADAPMLSCLGGWLVGLHECSPDVCSSQRVLYPGLSDPRWANRGGYPVPRA